MDRRLSAILGCLAAVALAMACASTQSGSGDDGSSGTGSEFKDDPGFGGGASGSGEAMADVSSLQPVYFDFDSYEIRADARPILKSNAESIRSNSGWGTVTVEGHCDERGSEEYNLALGERRANSVRRYLVDLGVPSSRLRTVSFGEAKPAVMGHDETAWRYNRRSEFSAAAN